MLELEEAERYAVAGLFTLALHSTASQADNGGVGWGEPEEGQDIPWDPNSEEPDPFWGRDLVLRGGLLDAVYFLLGLPAFKWAGLKALPSVAPTTDSASFRGAVRSLIAVLDEELAAAMPAPPSRRRGDSPKARAVDVPDELWDGLMDSSDDEGEELRQLVGGTGKGNGGELKGEQEQLEREEEDAELEADRRWERELEERQRAREEGGSSAGPRPAGESPLASLEAQRALAELSSPQGQLQRQRNAEYTELVRQLEDLSAAEEEKERAAAEERRRRQRRAAADKKAEGAGKATRAALAKGQVSPIALAALWELLQCCIGAGSAAGEAAKSAAADAEQDGAPSPKILRRQGPPPCVRWYDARARVALGLVSAWLQVPQRKFATLEVLLGSDKAPMTVLNPRGGDGIAVDRYRYLKVGLAALGGGALFAVTGGLAAPAIAAAAGSILGIVPGAGAAAGAVAGFMSTQVGVAAVTTTMATAGAATTGSKMAYRTADVKDFGFIELRDAPAPAALTASPAKQPSQPQRTATRTPSTHPRQDNGSSGDPGHLDPGHLTLGGGGNGGGGGMQRTPSTSSARSGSTSSIADDASGAALQGSSSTWKSWFNGKKLDEEDSSGGGHTVLPSPVRPAHPAEGVKLSAVIGISGWITAPDDFTAPWTALSVPTADRFALTWCASELQTLNSALGALLAKGAAGQAARLGMQHLLVGGAGLVSALGPTVILGAATGLLIENAWTVAIDRADKAGKLLAHVLMAGGGGGRPVTLVSHSMGARLVFSALLELCRRGARGLVQDVVLLGAPIPPAPERWRMARRVVAGRLVNGYSRADWLLSVMFWQGIAKPAAGLAPVEVAGVENVSLGSVVGGHFEYIDCLDEILELLQVETVRQAVE